MIKNLLILTIMVGAVYFVLKKLTVYRCPRCRSAQILKHYTHKYNTTDTVYQCPKCSAEFTKHGLLN